MAVHEEDGGAEPADLFGILRRTAARSPNAVAVVGLDGAPCVTYAEVLHRVERQARHLRALGVRSEDRVAIWCGNGAGFLEAYFAVAAAGAISVPLNLRLSAGETGAVLRDAAPRLLIEESAGAALLPDGANLLRVPLAQLGPAADAAELDREAALPGAPDPDQVAHLYYTSGSTGQPKGVMLTHRNVVTHARWARDELELSAGDTWGHIAPMFHLADAWATFAITLVGGRHVMLPRFEPAAALRLLAEAEVTLTNLIPTMLGRMVRDPALAGMTFPRLRRILSGGAPIAPALVERILEGFACEDYVQTYGMTETSPYLTLSLLHPHLRELPRAERLRYQCKTGRPFGGVELRVVDAAGMPVPADGVAVGEIQVRGPTVTPGYWQQPEATAAAFTADGFLRTGDLATLDREGYVDIVDRLKDVILSGGENVYSVEVEATLAAHPDVQEVAVVGRPDPDWGEIVCAVVAPVTGATLDEAELDRFCAARLSRFKCPRHYAFLDALPRLGSGKIAKRRLRERIHRGSDER